VLAARRSAISGRLFKSSINAMGTWDAVWPRGPNAGFYADALAAELSGGSLCLCTSSCQVSVCHCRPSIAACHAVAIGCGCCNTASPHLLPSAASPPVHSSSLMELFCLLGWSRSETWAALEADLCSPGWSHKLRAAGFDPSLPTVWVAEGLLMYLRPAEAEALFREMAGGLEGAKHPCLLP
jgi:hypothetical protein